MYGCVHICNSTPGRYFCYWAIRRSKSNLLPRQSQIMGDSFIFLSVPFFSMRFVLAALDNSRWKAELPIQKFLVQLISQICKLLFKNLHILWRKPVLRPENILVCTNF